MTRNRNTSGFSFLRFVLVLLLIVVAAAGAFGGFLYMGAQEVETHFRNAEASYNTCMEQIDSQDYTAALSSIRATAEEVSLVKKNLNGWQWDAAEKVPYIGDDVTCARQAAAIADDLTNSALLPMLSKGEDIFNAASSDDVLGSIQSIVTKLPDLLDAVTNARGIVKDCKTRTENLPTPHSDGVIELSQRVSEATTQADDAFANIDPLLEAIDGLGALANSLNSAFAPSVTSETVAA